MFEYTDVTPFLEYQLTGTERNRHDIQWTVWVILESPSPHAQSESDALQLPENWVYKNSKSALRIPPRPFHSKDRELRRVRPG